MESIVNYVQQNSIAIISIVVAIAGVIYGAHKSRRSKRLFYTIDSYNLIRDITERDEHLKILYNDHPVDNVTVSHIAIWNAGTATILKKHIAEEDTLRVTWEENVGVLSNIMVYPSAENSDMRANKIILREPRSQEGFVEWLGISFEFLDQNDGCVLQIAHTGLDSPQFKVLGTIIGAKPKMPKRVRTLIWKRDLSRLLHGMGYFALVFAATNLIWGESSKDFVVAIVTSLISLLVFFTAFLFDKSMGFIEKRYLRLIERFQKMTDSSR